MNNSTILMQATRASDTNTEFYWCRDTRLSVLKEKGYKPVTKSMLNKLKVNIPNASFNSLNQVVSKNLILCYKAEVEVSIKSKAKKTTKSKAKKK